MNRDRTDTAMDRTSPGEAQDTGPAGEDRAPDPVPAEAPPQHGESAGEAASETIRPRGEGESRDDL